MIIFTKLIFFYLLLQYNISYATDTSKVLFSINEKPYTSIDINQRIKYLDLLTNYEINLTEKEILEDFISVLLFNEFAIKNEINTDDKVISDYLNDILILYNKNINNIDISKKEEFNNLIKKNIKLDYQRKIVLENLLKKIDKDFLKLETSNFSDIFNINIEYYLVEKNQNTKDLNKLINLQKINKIDEYLKKELINYNYYKKNEVNLENIDFNIKNEILEKKEFFYINESQYYLIGTIKRNLKQNIDLKFTFFQIISKSNKTINNKDIKCNNIKKLETISDLKIKKFENVEISKLNKVLRDNLKFINQFIIINNDNQQSYVILCDIIYDIDLFEQLTLDSKINKEAMKIENEFIYQNKILFNYKSYE